MSNDFDAVFDAASAFAPDDPLAPVHAFMVRARDAYGRLPAPAPRADLAVLFRDQPERAALITLAPRPSTSPLRARTRRVRRVLLVAAALAIAVVTTGGLAVAGVLPGGIQKTVSDVLERVGVDVPRGVDSPPPPLTPSTAAADAPGSPAGANPGTATQPPGPGSTEPVGAADPSAPDASATTIPTLPTPALPTTPPLPTLPIDPPVDLPAPDLGTLPVIPSGDVPGPAIDLPIVPPVEIPPLPVDVGAPSLPDLPPVVGP